MLNKVQIIGNLGRDPEIRRTNDGKPVATLRIATSETWKDKATNERKERTEWHTVVIFNEGLAGVVERYTKKGSRIFVEGQLRTRKWTDQSNVERYSTEVVLGQYGGEVKLLDRAERTAPDQDAYGTTQSRDERQGATGGTSAGGRPNYDLDDDIPF